MKKYIRQFLSTIAIALALTFSFAGLTAGGTLYAVDPTAAAKSEACKGINGTTSGTCANGGVNLTNIVKAILNILSVIAGVAAVIMIIISGFKYITSNGDAQSVAGAKRTLIYAVVGLVVVALAQFIVRFVLSSV
jgi:hypothetical protein